MTLMKTLYLLLLLVSSLLSSRVMADPSEVTPAQAIERAPKALTDMHGALEKLKSPPDYVAAAFVNAVILEKAADEYVARKEATNAEFLYKEALGTMRFLQSQRSDWQPKVVSYRMLSLDRKIKALASPAQSGQPPMLTVPGVKPSTPNDSVPDGWRSFEFNGQKYYYVPLSFASVAQKP